ncbi:MAG: TonB-dependent receptor [Deltaproteobacteria bacterium]|nr:MAG: TonB-dependent receptor [Deltaproteobacteria bacterium]
MRGPYLLLLIPALLGAGEGGETTPPGPWRIKTVHPTEAEARRAAEQRKKAEAARREARRRAEAKRAAAEAQGPNRKALVAAGRAGMPASVRSAGRWPAARASTARAVSVLDRAALRGGARANVAEALEDADAVWARRVDLGAALLSVRGLSAPRLHLRVDGLPIGPARFPFYQALALQLVDAFALEQVEVLRGAALPLYGASAGSGTISLYLERPRLRAKDGAWQLFGLAEASSITWEKSVHGAVGRRDATAAFLGAGSWQDLDTYASTQGDLREAGYAQGHLLAKGTVRLGPGQLHAGWRGSWQLGAADPALCTPLDCTRNTLRALQIADLGWTGRLGAASARATAYLVALTSVRERAYEARVAKSEDSALSGGVTSALTFEATAGLPVTVGIEADLDRLRSAASITPAEGAGQGASRGHLPPSASTGTAALFASASLSVTERLRLEGALRAERTWREAQADPLADLPEAAELSLLASAGAAVLLAPFAQIVVHLERGRRPPTLDELSGYGLFDGAYDLPNPALTPETLWTSEAGVRIERPAYRIEVFVWHTEIEDAILRRPAELDGARTILWGGARLPYARHLNGDPVWVDGVEAALWGRLPFGLSLGASGTAAVGEDRTQGEALARLPPPFASVTVRKGFAGGHFLSARILAVDALPRLAPLERLDPRICGRPEPGCGPPDGFVTVEVRGGARLSRHAYLSASLRNLLGSVHRMPGSALPAPAPGASVRLSVDLE